MLSTVSSIMFSFCPKVFCLVVVWYTTGILWSTFFLIATRETSKYVAETINCSNSNKKLYLGIYAILIDIYIDNQIVDVVTFWYHRQLLTDWGSQIMRMLKVLGLDRTAGEILGLFSIEKYFWRCSNNIGDDQCQSM